jgi:hypothetical protein
MIYDRFMTTQPPPTGPNPEAITRTIIETWPETDIVTIEGAAFFSVDPEKHWPNFATIVTTDEHDDGTPSSLSRPGVFRLNLGVSRATFERLVGSIATPDYAALDRLLPHPVYAKQLWISILNPSDATFRDVVLPLLTEAHDRLAASGRGTASAAQAADGPIAASRAIALSSVTDELPWRRQSK